MERAADGRSWRRPCHRQAEGEPFPVYPESRRGLLSELLGGELDSLTEELRSAITSARSTSVEVREPGLS